MTTYQKFQTLCIQKHVTEYRVAKDTGISASTFTHWGRGDWHPKSDKLRILAEYFGVSLEYFYEDIPAPDTEKDILFSAYKKASPEMRKAVRKLLDIQYLEVEDEEE